MKAKLRDGGFYPIRRTSSLSIFKSSGHPTKNVQISHFENASE
jgi:hypothetical protein